MAPQIGSIGCARVSGVKNPPGQRLDVWQVIGIDGVGVQLKGPGLGRSTFKVIQFGPAPLLQQWLIDLKALVGTYQTIENDNGQSFGNMIIETISEPQRRTAVDFFASEMRYEVTLTALSG